MGIENVKLVYASWRHLPHVPFRLLGYMAMVSMDDDNPPLFWGGREQMAFAIGRMTPEEPATSDNSQRAQDFRKARTADFEAAKVAMRSIVQAGAAVVRDRARPGHNAVYALHLAAATGKAEPVERGRVSLPNGEGSAFLMGKGEPSPEEAPLRGADSRTNVGTTQGAKSPLVTDSLAAVENDYAEANSILHSLPDLGSQYMQQVDHIEGYADRVIAAAALARAERSA